jgi:hypothetical protein
MKEQESKMKNHSRLLWLGLVFVLACVFACVTINIYFPAEKVESVAGEIVNDIRGPKPSEQDKPTEGQKGSFLPVIRLALGASPAWAQDVTTVSNATIRALKESMKARYAQMKPYYQKGMLVEENSGYVSQGSVDALGLKERRDLKSYVDAENQDRRTLYQEVAKALNIEASQIGRIEEIFAKEWQKSVR